MNAFVFKRRAANHGLDLLFDGSFSQCGDQFLFGEAVGVVEVLFHQCIVEFGDGFEEFGAVFGGFGGHVVGDVVGLVGLSLVILVPDVGFHIQQIDDAGERVLGADGEGKHNGVGTEFFADLGNHGIEISALSIHFVDVTDAGHIVFVGLMPDGFRLWLDAAYSAEDGDSAIQHAQGTFHLDGKVHMTWGVDDVDFELLAEVFPKNSSGGTGDGDSAFLLLNHPIHCRRTFIDFADFVILASIKKDALGSGCLTGIDMSHNTNIPDI